MNKNQTGMEKVYVFIAETIVDGESETKLCAKVFSTREKARDALKEFAEKERKLCNEADWVVVTDDDDCFEAQMEGEYCYNHSCGYVAEREVL